MTSPGPRGWQGQPNAYTRTRRVMANSDILLQTTFQSTQGPTTPNSIQWRLDSLTSVQNIQEWTSVTPVGSQVIIQIPGSILVPTRTWYGTEMFQLWIQAVIPDSNASSGSITANKILALELVCESVPPGT